MKQKVIPISVMDINVQIRPRPNGVECHSHYYYTSSELLLSAANGFCALCLAGECYTGGSVDTVTTSVVGGPVEEKHGRQKNKSTGRQEDDRDADVVCIQSSWLASHSHLITKRMCLQLPRRPPYWTGTRNKDDYSRIVNGEYYIIPEEGGQR